MSEAEINAATRVATDALVEIVQDQNIDGDKRIRAACAILDRQRKD